MVEVSCMARFNYIPDEFISSKIYWHVCHLDKWAVFKYDLWLSSQFRRGKGKQITVYVELTLTKLFFSFVHIKLSTVHACYCPHYDRIQCFVYKKNTCNLNFIFQNCSRIVRAIYCLFTIIEDKWIRGYEDKCSKSSISALCISHSSLIVFSNIFCLLRGIKLTFRSMSGSDHFKMQFGIIRCIHNVSCLASLLLNSVLFTFILKKTPFHLRLDFLIAWGKIYVNDYIQVVLDRLAQFCHNWGDHCDFVSFHRHPVRL